MKVAISGLVGVPSAMIVVSNLILTPPLKVTDRTADQRATARHFLSDLAEAGKRVYAGSCADCHGRGGTGGRAPRLDTMGFAVEARRARELHDALLIPTSAHAGLAETLGAPGDRDRFNDVQRVGKYLREVRLSRLRKAAE